MIPQQNTYTPKWLQFAFTLGGAILIAYLLRQLFDYIFDSEEEIGKKRRVFISHSWNYDKDYKTLIKRFDYYGFDFYNHSIPEGNPLEEETTRKIEAGIRKKMRGCSKVLVLGGHYANNYWIKKEVQIAKELGKKVVAIRPWGALMVPNYLKSEAHQILGFNAKSIIEKIK